MANSYAIQINLACPYCGQIFQVETWLVVDSNERPDLAHQVIEGSLHKVSCPTCGRIDRLEVPFLFYRPEHESQLVFSVPDEKTNDQIQKMTWPLLSCLAHSLGKMWEEAWLDEIDILPRPTFWEVITGMEKPDQECWYQELMFQGEMHLFADQESRMLFNLVLEFIRKESSKNKCQLLRDHPMLLTEPALSALAFLLGLSDYEDNSEDKKPGKFYSDQFKQYLKAGTIREMVGGIHYQDILATIPDEVLPLVLQALILNAALQEADHPPHHILRQLFDSLLELLSHSALPVPARYAILDHLASPHNNCCNDWETINFLTEVLSLTPKGHPSRIYFLRRLEKAIMSENALFGDQIFQGELVHCYQEMVQLMPQAHPDRIIYLGKLADIMRQLYNDHHNVDMLSKAIDFYQEMIRFTSEDQPDRISYYSELGDTLAERYDLLNEVDDLSSATNYYQKALQQMPEGHAEQSIVLNNLGTCYSSRYERWGSLDDISMAITTYEEALRLCTIGTRHHLNTLNNLAYAYHVRYRKLGHSADLTVALSHYDQALAMSPEKTLRHPVLLKTMATAKLERYLLQEEMDDFTSAIDCCQKVIRLLRDDYQSVTASVLDKMATVYLTHHKLEGEVDDLSHAIDCLREAVQLTPEIQDGRGMYLNNLGSAYMVQYHQTGDQADLTAAVDCFEEAVRLTPATDPAKLMFLTNLGSVHAIRYQGDVGMDDKKGEG